VKNVLRKTAYVNVLLLLFVCAVSGQSQAETPERGSVERQAITDALRLPVQKQLKTKVIFKIDHLKVLNGWAFMMGVPKQLNGSPVDYRGTPYQAAFDAGAFDDGIVALLRKRNGKWQVVEYVIGATDVPYVDWDQKHRAPSEIFQNEAP
jgi:hypothetical protein